MGTQTTVPITTAASAIATLIVTILVLAGVNLGPDATVAAITGSATTLFTLVLGLVLPSKS